MLSVLCSKDRQSNMMKDELSIPVLSFNIIPHPNHVNIMSTLMV